MLALFAAGCSDDSRPSDAVALSGTVSSGGGSTPIPLPDAIVSVYRTQPSTSVLVASTTTDADGGFTVALPQGDDGGIYYAIARREGGVELAVVLGSQPPAAVIVNEMTTVATAYAMAQFLRRDGLIAGDALPLQIAAGMAGNLVAAQTGAPSTMISQSPNGDETNAWRSLGTLSNILAGCVQGDERACAELFVSSPSLQGTPPANTLQAMVNIARNPAAHVAELFALGEISKSYTPALTALQGPDSTDGLQKLDAWTLAVKVNESGSESCPFGGPGNIAFDARGYAWININVVQGTPNSAHCMIVLKPDGRPADGIDDTPTSPITGGGITGQGFGVIVDPDGDVWSGNFGWGNDKPTGSVSVFSPSGVALSPSAGYVDGTQRVQGLGTDALNNIWIASYGNDAVIVFPGGDPESAFAPYIDDNRGPFGVAVDNDGAGWVTYTRSSTVSRFTLGEDALVRQFTVPLAPGGAPKGIALDSQGVAWVAEGRNSLVYAISPSGTVLGSFDGGGIHGPWGVTVDARDHVWASDFGDASNTDVRYGVTRLCGSTPANCPPGLTTGDPISPPSGYTLPSAGSPVLLASGEPLYGAGRPPSYKPLMRPTAVQVDMAGNAWVTNNWKPSGLNDVALNPGGDGIVIFVGLAAPTRTPALGTPQSP